MNASVERVVYLGYRLVVTPYIVLVSTSDGRPVGVCQSMSSVRRLVRGYLREARA